MKTIVALAALLAMAWATPVFATECPTDMKEIDQALAKASTLKKLSAGDLEKVKKFRAEGEQLHKAGKHKESMDTLEQAKLLLGI